MSLLNTAGHWGSPHICTWKGRWTWTHREGGTRGQRNQWCFSPRALAVVAQPTAPENTIASGEVAPTVSASGPQWCLWPRESGSSGSGASDFVPLVLEVLLPHTFVHGSGSHKPDYPRHNRGSLDPGCSITVTLLPQQQSLQHRRPQIWQKGLRSWCPRSDASETSSTNDPPQAGTTRAPGNTPERWWKVESANSQT